MARQGPRGPLRCQEIFGFSVSLGQRELELLSCFFWAAGGETSCGGWQTLKLGDNFHRFGRRFVTRYPHTCLFVRRKPCRLGIPTSKNGTLIVRLNFQSFMLVLSVVTAKGKPFDVFAVLSVQRSLRQRSFSTGCEHVCRQATQNSEAGRCGWCCVLATLQPFHAKNFSTEDAASVVEELLDHILMPPAQPLVSKGGGGTANKSDTQVALVSSKMWKKQNEGRGHPTAAGLSMIVHVRVPDSYDSSSIRCFTCTSK